ncbi:MAG: HAD family hydrolase [Brevefilum sp.]|nr:HAD family hydrolase [Brevefilum sp.]
MTPTVLFDLDDTLLSTNMDQFLPDYFKGLSTALCHLGSAWKVTRQVNTAVKQMVANQDPDKTLKEVFDQHFYPPLGSTEAACKQQIKAFYQYDYPHLKPITQPRPEAKQLVDWCLSQGVRMAIATNPLFPLTATRQRIEWAGLNPDDFEFFTTYDDFHFTKPHLAYYAEVLGRLGWPEGPVAMTGDNFAHDLLPMDTMGYQTFWVDPSVPGVRWKGGALAEVKPWLSQIMQDSIPQLADDPEVHIAILRATPAVLDTWLRQIRVDLVSEKSASKHEHFSHMLSHIADYECQVFHPLWASLSKDPSSTLPPLGEIEPPTHIDDQRHDPQKDFNRFLEARLTALDIIDHLDHKGAFNQPDHNDQSGSQSIKDVLRRISEQDRKALQNLNNLLDIHKIY